MMSVKKKKKEKKKKKKHGECANPPAPDAVSLFTIQNLSHFDTRKSFSGSR